MVGMVINLTGAGERVHPINRQPSQRYSRRWNAIASDANSIP